MAVRETIVRPLKESELDEAINMASQSLAQDTTKEGKKIYPWTEKQNKPYYKKTYEGVFGKPGTVFLGKFVDGKMVAVGYSTPVKVWLSAINQKQKTAYVEKALKQLGLKMEDVVYMGGLTVRQDSKGQGHGPHLMQSRLRHMEGNYKAAIAYHVEGSKSQKMLEELGFERLFLTEEKPVTHWLGKIL